MEPSPARFIVAFVAAAGLIAAPILILEAAKEFHEPDWPWASDDRAAEIDAQVKEMRQREIEERDRERWAWEYRICVKVDRQHPELLLSCRQP